MALLSDEMWARIEPMLQPAKGVMGRPMREHRDLVEGEIYRTAPAKLGETCQRTSAPADGLEAAPPRLNRAHLGHGPDRIAGAGGRQG
jgi:hypothetical protein